VWSGCCVVVSVVCGSSLLWWLVLCWWVHDGLSLWSMQLQKLPLNKRFHQVCQPKGFFEAMADFFRYFEFRYFNLQRYLLMVVGTFAGMSLVLLGSIPLTKWIIQGFRRSPE